MQESNAKLLELVRKGAPSRAPDESRGEIWLQTDPAILERTKRAASNRSLNTSVNTWITEAMLAQLKKEGF